MKQLFKSYLKALEREDFLIWSVSLEATEGERLDRRVRGVEDPYPIYSATKSLSSLAVGMAAAEGLLDLDDRLLDFFPEYAAGAAEGHADMRIRDLLCMSSGHRCFQFGAGDRRLYEEDWAKLFFELPLRAAPGERFFYSNSDVYLVGRILARRAGVSLRDYLLPRLFRPAGIPNPIWGTCPRGHQNAASKLFLTAAEFARLGHLLLHRGVYEGRRLLPAAYFDAATRPQIDSAPIAAFRGMAEEEQALMRGGYGYWFWLGERGSYRADGKYGQFLAVYPREGLALSVLAQVADRPYRLLRIFEHCLKMG